MTESAVDVDACRANLIARQRREAERREAERQEVAQAVRNVAGAILPRFPQVRRAYLFGSALRGLRSTSDVDIAIDGKLAAEEYFALWRELDHAVPGWQIDLVELDRDLRFAGHVREEGMVIYERPGPDAKSRDSG